MTTGEAALGAFALASALLAGWGYIRADHLPQFRPERAATQSDISRDGKIRVVRAYASAWFIGSLIILLVVVSRVLRSN